MHAYNFNKKNRLHTKYTEVTRIYNNKKKKKHAFIEFVFFTIVFMKRQCRYTWCVFTEWEKNVRKRKFFF